MSVVVQEVSERLAVLTAERDARVLVEEAVDVTLPTDRARLGARHPVTLVSERIVDVFVAMESSPFVTLAVQSAIPAC